MCLPQLRQSTAPSLGVNPSINKRRDVSMSDSGIVNIINFIRAYEPRDP